MGNNKSRASDDVDLLRGPVPQSGGTSASGSVDFDEDINLEFLTFMDAIPNDLAIRIAKEAIDKGNVSPTTLRLVCKKLRGVVDTILYMNGGRRSEYGKYNVCVTMEGFDVVGPHNLLGFPIRMHVYHAERHPKPTIDQEVPFHWVIASTQYLSIADIIEAYPFAQFSWRMILDPYNPDSFGGPQLPGPKVTLICPDNHVIEGSVIHWKKSEMLVDYPLDHGSFNPDKNFPVIQHTRIRERDMGQWGRHVVRLLIPVFGMKPGEKFLTQSGTDWKSVAFHWLTETQWREKKETVRLHDEYLVIVSDNDGGEVISIFQQGGAEMIKAKDCPALNTTNNVPVTYVTKQSPFYMFM